MSSLPQQTDKTDEVMLPELSNTDSAALAETDIKTTHSIDNVPVKISAVLGKTKIDIAQLRALDGDAVIELDRKVGEPIDLYVNDRLIARGELVMVDGALGVTMTEIVKQDDL